jgi:3-oxoadipate enol-lactonase
MLLVHEMGGSVASWDELIPPFAATRRVIAVDLRGSGQSEKPRAGHELFELADDLADLIVQLRLPAVDAIGVAAGGLVSSLLAIRHPRKVHRLVISSGSDVITDQAKEYNRARAEKVMALGMRAVSESTLANSFPKGFENLRAAYLPIFLANDPFCYAEMSLALTRLELPADALASIRCPALVMSSTHDFIWPPEVGQRLASRISGAAFEALPDSAHLAHIQNPRGFALAVENFLGRDLP